MGSDRARISYDPSRKWRGLVAQQGRVTVEADWNEAAAIEAVEDRAVTLDVVGPVGTPDGGYAVTATGPGSPPASGSPPGSTEGDLSVGPGTLYLGGERLDLDTAVDLANQPDWLDAATGTLWAAPSPPPASPPAGSANELVYLLAIEQEVSAVEDPALADVALGGPDTMQRLRVLQRFVRWPTQATSCDQAWSEVQSAWAGIGLKLDPASMRLASAAALQVGFVTEPAPPSACQPVATGGYLGAENQLIRVQVASVDANGVPTIVWGFDDATFMYELTSAQPDSSGHLVLTLATAPVDSYHNPVTGQAVELLRDAASLTPDTPGSATADGFIAAAAGPVFALTHGYDSSSGTVAVAGSLPAGYQGAKQLYLRVWQGSMPAPAGTPVTLTGAGATTGVTVTLSSAGGKFHPGDFWRFALRPSVPNLIYPARYGVAAQPPDGARVLACPVGLVTWPAQGAPTVTSCIPTFDNLVELTARGGGCCTVKVTPGDLATTSLKTLLAPYAGKGPVTVCFAPGTYTLTEPLVFDATFAGISLEGCGGRAVLEAPASPGIQFLLGLIVLQGPGSVTLRGIDLVQPLVSFAPPANAFTALSTAAGSTANQTLLDEFGRNLLVAIGVSAQNTPGLVIEDCTFVLSVGPAALKSNIFAAGIFASGSLPEATVSGCSFRTIPAPSTVPFYDLAAGNQPAFPYQLSFGYLQVPVSPRQSSPPASPPTAPAIGLLNDATIEDCRFVGVTVPVLVVAQLGTIRVNNNTILDCYGGIWLLSMANSALTNAFDLIPSGDAGVRNELISVGMSALGDRIFVLALGIARVLPTTPPLGLHIIGLPIAVIDPATLTLATQGLRTFLTQAASALPGAAAVSGPAAAIQPVQPPAVQPVQPVQPVIQPVLAQPVQPPPVQPVQPAVPVQPVVPIQQPVLAQPVQPVTTIQPAQPVQPAQPAQPAGSPPSSAAGSPPSSGRDLLTLLPSLNNILTNLGAAAAGVPLATDTGSAAVLRLALAGSQVDAVVPSSYSGAGLLVADFTSTPGSALLTGNRIRNRFPNGQAAVVIGLGDAAVTGNIVANEVPIVTSTTAAVVVPSTHSLLLSESSTQATPPVAVVGNVFVSPPILPGRQDPLPQWLTLNAVVASTGA
jgi:hypothetical protein